MRHAFLLLLAVGTAWSTAQGADWSAADPDGPAVGAAARAALPNAVVSPLTRTVSPLAGLGSATTGTIVDLAVAARKLEGAAKGLGVRVEATTVRVDLEGDVLFDFDEAEIRADAEPALRAVASLAAEAPRTRLAVGGHTDAKGANAYNMRLSERRARAVAGWLEAHAVAASRLTAEGHGEGRPVAPNARPDGTDDPEGRQRNRRVEIVFSE